MNTISTSQMVSVLFPLGQMHWLKVQFVSIACISLSLVSELQAQTFITLHTFTATPISSPYTNADGADPNAAALLLSGNRLYGTTVFGGMSGSGTVFALNIDGTDFTNLHNFENENSAGVRQYAGLILSGNTLYGTDYGGTNGNGTVFALNTDGTGFTNLHSFKNSDGINPYAGLILSSNTLFGTTVYGGSYGGSPGNGTMFALNIDGTGFTNLHSFKNSDGVNPYAGLILSGNTLYGTTASGGRWGIGTVFALKIDGTGFTNLHSFENSDGANPYAGLILSGNTLYGTTDDGGTFGRGNVFAVNINGTSFTNLHNFNESDGWGPQAGLILSGNTLYGTTTWGGKPAIGGNNGNGTVFAINTDGTGFTNLYSFTATVGTQGNNGTNSDGANPVGGLILSSNILYGTTQTGGSSGSGTVFAINTDGTGFTNLYSFTATVGTQGDNGTNSDGANPVGGLILSSNILYGTTQTGGSSGSGTVFSLALPPPLSLPPPQMTLTLSESDLVLMWPTNYTGFTLQSTTNLSSPVWTANLPAPVVVNGQNTVTNPISGTQQFFRLSQ